MNELEQLKKENAELKHRLLVAQLGEDSLLLAIKSMELAKNENSGFEPSLSVYQREIDHVISLASKPEPRVLADIKADAVDSIIENVVPRGEVAGGDDAYSGEDIQEYANKLRGES
jgi:hypothetical protein